MKKYSLFNARIAGLTESRVFGAAFRTQRGVIPIRAYFEWTGTTGKQKHHLARPDGLPLLVAAPWHQTEHGGRLTVSCTLVTCPPTPDLQHVHERRLALLLSKDLEAWLTGPSEVAQGVAVTSWPVGC